MCNVESLFGLWRDFYVSFDFCSFFWFIRDMTDSMKIETIIQSFIWFSSYFVNIRMPFRDSRYALIVDFGWSISNMKIPFFFHSVDSHWLFEATDDYRSIFNWLHLLVYRLKNFVIDKHLPLEWIVCFVFFCCCSLVDRMSTHFKLRRCFVFDTFGAWVLSKFGTTEKTGSHLYGHTGAEMPKIIISKYAPFVIWFDSFDPDGMQYTKRETWGSIGIGSNNI